MKTIYKYPIEVRGVTRIELPKGYQILSVQFQNGILMLWAKVEMNSTNNITATIRSYFTGDPIPAGDEPMEFIGTVQSRDVMLRSEVSHVFVEVDV